MKSLLAISLCIPLVASADILGPINTIGIHTVSQHFPVREFNNSNPGIYLRTAKGFIVGTYLNSYSRQTWYAGWTTPEWHRITLTGAIATGYYDTIGPLVAPAIRLYSFDNEINIHLIAIPPVSPKSSGVVHLTAEWRFK